MPPRRGRAGGAAGAVPQRAIESPTCRRWRAGEAPAAPLAPATAQYVQRLREIAPPARPAGGPRLRALPGRPERRPGLRRVVARSAGAARHGRHELLRLRRRRDRVQRWRSAFAPGWTPRWLAEPDPQASSPRRRAPSAPRAAVRAASRPPLEGGRRLISAAALREGADVPVQQRGARRGRLHLVQQRGDRRHRAAVGNVHRRQAGVGDDRADQVRGRRPTPWAPRPARDSEASRRMRASRRACSSLRSLKMKMTPSSEPSRAGTGSARTATGSRCRRPAPAPSRRARCAARRARGRSSAAPGRSVNRATSVSSERQCSSAPGQLAERGVGIEHRPSPRPPTTASFESATMRAPAPAGARRSAAAPRAPAR
jgi:hypothetical protein